MAENKYTYKIGRRKTSTATVRLFEGAGESMINDKKFTAVYPREIDQKMLLRPFDVAELKSKDFHFTVKSSGGGVVSQREAIVLALSRAIDAKFPETHKLLKQEGLLTRDSRMVERKKTGLRKARKSEQYSKR